MVILHPQALFGWYGDSWAWPPAEVFCPPCLRHLNSSKFPWLSVLRDTVSGASSRRRRLKLALRPWLVGGPARRRALSVSVPRRLWAGRGAGRAARRRRRRGRGPGPGSGATAPHPGGGCRLSSPQRRGRRAPEGAAEGRGLRGAGGLGPRPSRASVGPGGRGTRRAAWCA